MEKEARDEERMLLQRMNEADKFKEWESQEDQVRCGKYQQEKLVGEREREGGGRKEGGVVNFLLLVSLSLLCSVSLGPSKDEIYDQNRGRTRYVGWWWERCILRTRPRELLLAWDVSVRIRNCIRSFLYVCIRTSHKTDCLYFML